MMHDEETDEAQDDEEGVDDALETIFRIMSKRMGIPSKAESAPEEKTEEENQIQPGPKKDDSELHSIPEFIRPLMEDDQEPSGMAPERSKPKVRIVIGKAAERA